LLPCKTSLILVFITWKRSLSSQVLDRDVENSFARRILAKFDPPCIVPARLDYSCGYLVHVPKLRGLGRRALVRGGFRVAVAAKPVCIY
jgi:hypothetical protein